MPLVDMNDLLKHAYRNHYAVGAFSPCGLDGIAAIATVAEHCRSPVILSFDESRFGPDGLELALAAAERAAQRASVPVALELAHSRSLESAVRAINLGCNGVSIFPSHKPFPVAVADTRRIVDMAHGCDVATEGAPGSVGVTNGGDPAAAEATTPTSIEEAKAFVQRAGVDCLAVSIASANGGRPRGRGKLDMDRLRRLNDALQIPLSFRFTSGLGDEHFHKLIQHGVAKIRYEEPLDEAADSHMRARLRNDARCGFSELTDGVRGAIVAEAEHCMQRFGSAGRAAEVLVQCRAWQPVQHVIVYNVEGADLHQVETMMARGHEVFAKIPGVRRVVSGWAMTDKPKYRCCWLIEFANERVVASYRDHPEHVAFANRYFRPVAPDRVTIDFAPLTPNLAPAATAPGRRQVVG